MASLSAPGHTPLNKRSGRDAELRGVTIPRDTLRVPDAGDQAAGSSVTLSASRPGCRPTCCACYTEAGVRRVHGGLADGYLLLADRPGSPWTTCPRGWGGPWRASHRLSSQPGDEGGDAFAEDAAGKRLRIGDVSFARSSLARAAFSPPLTQDRRAQCRPRTLRHAGGLSQDGVTARCSARTWSTMAFGRRKSACR